MFNKDSKGLCNQNCAYHIFLSNNSIDHQAVIENIENDCVQYFDENFTKTKYFCCNLSVLPSRLILHGAFNIIRFIHNEYPTTNFNKIMHNAFKRIFWSSSADRYNSEKRSLNRILEYYHEFLHDDTFTLIKTPKPEFALVLASWPRFLSFAIYSFSKPDLNYNLATRVEPVWLSNYCLKYNYFMEDSKWGLQIIDDTLQVPLYIYPSRDNDEFRDLKVLLFSQRILQIFYLIVFGSSNYKLIDLSSLNISPDTEVCNIISAFNASMNLSLFDLCRRKLFRSVNNHKDLETLFVLNNLPKYLIEKLFVKNIDICSDCKFLQMTTLFERYEEDNDLIFNDYGLSANFVVRIEPHVLM